MTTIKELEKMERELSKLSMQAYRMRIDDPEVNTPEMKENLSSLRLTISRACGFASVLAYELRKIERKNNNEKQQ